MLLFLSGILALAFLFLELYYDSLFGELSAQPLVHQSLISTK